MKIFDTQPKPGMPVRHSTFYKAIVRMAKAWEKLSVHNGHVDWSNGMPTIVVDSASSDMDYSDFAFGFSISGAVVSVRGGYIIHGKRYPILTYAKDVTITDDLTYIYVHHIIGDVGASILSSTVFPSCTETTLDLPLHLWKLNSGVVSLETGGILHLGFFVLPEIFS